MWHMPLIFRFVIEGPIDCLVKELFSTCLVPSRGIGSEVVFEIRSSPIQKLGNHIPFRRHNHRHRLHDAPQPLDFCDVAESRVGLPQRVKLLSGITLRVKNSKTSLETSSKICPS